MVVSVREFMVGGLAWFALCHQNWQSDPLVYVIGGRNKYNYTTINGIMALSPTPACYQAAPTKV